MCWFQSRQINVPSFIVSHLLIISAVVKCHVILHLGQSKGEAPFQFREYRANFSENVLSFPEREFQVCQSVRPIDDR